MSTKQRTVVMFLIALSVAISALVVYAVLLLGQFPNISDYRSWKKVNAQPLKMEEEIAAMCIKMPQYAAINPHMEKFITVYVNDVGREAMFSFKPMAFPPGSIIVKEKHGRISDGKPELLTVMLKKDAGWNPSVGDWEFFTANANMAIDKDTDVDHCISCHRSVPERDYTFRSYLPKQTG